MSWSLVYFAFKHLTLSVTSLKSLALFSWIHAFGSDDCKDFTVLITSLSSWEKAGDPSTVFPLMCWLFFNHLIKKGAIIQPGVSSCCLPVPHSSLIKLVAFGNCACLLFLGHEKQEEIVTCKKKKEQPKVSEVCDEDPLGFLWVDKDSQLGYLFLGFSWVMQPKKEITWSGSIDL